MRKYKWSHTVFLLPESDEYLQGHVGYNSPICPIIPDMSYDMLKFKLQKRLKPHNI
jgi:hypothetical protein